MYKICFTGYRPFKLPFAMSEKDSCYNLFVQKSRQLIQSQIELGYTYFISGMAQGTDMLFAEIVLELKKTYPHVMLECALPFKGQTSKWSDEIKERYKNILNSCDKVTVICNSYSKSCFLKRNKYMVDSCDKVIAVYDGKKGGTRFTIDYARKKGKQVMVIDPSGLIYSQESINEGEAGGKS